MLSTILATLARFGGPLIVKFAPWLLPVVGWVRPAFKVAKWALIVGVVAYVTYWFVTPTKDPAAQCQAAVTHASNLALKARAESDRKAQEAAANARRAVQSDLEAAAERIADLERALAARTDDPVAFPAPIVKELRR